MSGEIGAYNTTNVVFVPTVSFKSTQEGLNIKRKAINQLLILLWVLKIDLKH